MAKLILYSDQIIKENRKVDCELLNAFNKNSPSIAYIPSCSDLSRKYFKPKVEYYNANTVVYVCKDGDGIIVNDNNVKMIGNVAKIG